MISLLTFSLIITAIFTAVFQHKDNKKWVLYCAFLIGILSIANMYFQHEQELEQNARESELKRVNDLLVGYTSGGTGNKPQLSFGTRIRKDKDYDEIKFIIHNYGSFPLSNVFYEIEDTETGIYNFQKLHKIQTTPKNWSKNQILEFQKYSLNHEEELNPNGQWANIPKGVGFKVYKGKILKGRDARYRIMLSWNNEKYVVYYGFIRDKFGAFSKKIETMIYEKENLTKISDIKKFFPLSPPEIWDSYVEWTGNK
jgi:hypothetical protein